MSLACIMSLVVYWTFSRVAFLSFCCFAFCLQGNHLEPSCGLPAGESPQPMGFLHHMERWETGAEAFPEPESSQPKEGMSLGTANMEWCVKSIGLLTNQGTNRLINLSNDRLIIDLLIIYLLIMELN